MSEQCKISCKGDMQYYHIETSSISTQITISDENKNKLNQYKKEGGYNSFDDIITDLFKFFEEHS